MLIQHFNKKYVNNTKMTLLNNINSIFIFVCYVSCIYVCYIFYIFMQTFSSLQHPSFNTSLGSCHCYKAVSAALSLGLCPMENQTDCELSQMFWQMTLHLKVFVTNYVSIKKQSISQCVNSQLSEGSLTDRRLSIVYLI